MALTSFRDFVISTASKKDVAVELSSNCMQYRHSLISYLDIVSTSLHNYHLKSLRTLKFESMG